MSNSLRPHGLQTPWNSPGQNTGVGRLSLLQDFRFSRTPGFPLDCKEIKPVNPKGNLSWIFIGRTDAETPILWPPDGEELTHWKRSWCWERLKADGEGDDRGWDGWMASSLYGHEFEQAPRVGDGQGSLVCCSPWGHKKSGTWLSDWTEHLKETASLALVNIEGRREIWWRPLSVFSLAWVFCIFKKPRYGKYKE